MANTSAHDQLSVPINLIYHTTIVHDEASLAEAALGIWQESVKSLQGISDEQLSKLPENLRAQTRSQIEEREKEETGMLASAADKTDLLRMMVDFEGTYHVQFDPEAEKSMEHRKDLRNNASVFQKYGADEALQVLTINYKGESIRLVQGSQVDEYDVTHDVVSRYTINVADEERRLRLLFGHVEAPEGFPLLSTELKENMETRRYGSGPAEVIHSFDASSGNRLVRLEQRLHGTLIDEMTFSGYQESHGLTLPSIIEHRKFDDEGRLIWTETKVLTASSTEIDSSSWTLPTNEQTQITTVGPTSKGIKIE